jgi:hypothetical protein
MVHGTSCSRMQSKENNGDISCPRPVCVDRLEGTVRVCGSLQLANTVSTSTVQSGATQNLIESDGGEDYENFPVPAAYSTVSCTVLPYLVASQLNCTLTAAHFRKVPTLGNLQVVLLKNGGRSAGIAIRRVVPNGLERGLATERGPTSGDNINDKVITQQMGALLQCKCNWHNSACTTARVPLLRAGKERPVL